MKAYFLALLMALNQLGNAVLGGDPDMSVSARAGYARAQGSKVGAGVCELLDRLDPRDGDHPRGDHCDVAITNHERRDR